tara:strand:+ start:2751 stop:2993 length:243 start_codon:yes stop_codon:yes gene_type:complete
MQVSFHTFTPELEDPEFVHIEYSSADGQYTGKLAFPVHAFTGLDSAGVRELIADEVKKVVNNRKRMQTFTITSSVEVEDG